MLAKCWGRTKRRNGMVSGKKGTEERVFTEVSMLDKTLHVNIIWSRGMACTLGSVASPKSITPNDLNFQHMLYPTHKTSSLKWGKSSCLHLRTGPARSCLVTPSVLCRLEMAMSNQNGSFICHRPGSTCKLVNLFEFMFADDILFSVCSLEMDAELLDILVGLSKRWD